MGGPATGIHHRLPAVELSALARAAEDLQGVRRSELAPGDRVTVGTRNSIYTLIAAADGTFTAAGGWFARQGNGPTTVKVVGCTAGGHAVFADLVAAEGLFLEFDNGVTTTRIRSVRVQRAGA
jgi:hypothetical protein